MRVFNLACFLLCSAGGASAGGDSSKIDRRKVVQMFNPHRNASSKTTPLQVGNGNFAFGVDVTGLQTFSPFATLSTWGWHNFSLPTTPGQTSPDDFTGLNWWTHGRLVNYDQPNPAENDISNWLIQNPQRINLGTIGFSFNGVDLNEDDLENKSQTLDLWTGNISSSFVYKRSEVSVQTWCDQETDTVGVKIDSSLLASGNLGIFFDFPYPDVNKFDDPFVGVYNATQNHTTTIIQSSSQGATIRHDLDETSYYVSASWNNGGKLSGPNNGTHRYVLQPSKGVQGLQLVANFSPSPKTTTRSFEDITLASQRWWQNYWNSGAFIDLTASSSSNATELQRITILSQYLLAVNSASTNSPQESGLVNTGWYGKFHLEMTLWHLSHFSRWGHFDLIGRSMPNMYNRFLESSYDRARDQGYQGARWGKMTDPTGRSAPGEINSLLIWQQPHPMYFAELEYRAYPNEATLKSWDEVLTASADFMASFAFYNDSTKVYDLGPPMYPVSENTKPNSTVNPAFEIAQWRFGFDIAIKWKERQGQTPSTNWTKVRDSLPPLPTADGAFAVYEGIPDMWQNNTTVQDHPAMAGIYGLLPPPLSGPPLNMTVVRNTADKIRDLWNYDDLYSWDFPLLAMNSLRLGDTDQALAYLLSPLFQFDDAGYPEGGTRVATPYFPGSGGFMMAMAMMAGGWDGDEGPKFPEGWDVKVEGFLPAL